MASERRFRRVRVFLGALTGATVVHGLLLLFLVAIGFGRTTTSGGWIATLAALKALTSDRIFAEHYDVVSEIDFVAESEVLPPLAPTGDPGDEARTVLTESAPRIAAGNDPRAPSADSGKGSGSLLDPDVAYRRDSQDLQAQLTDGARVVSPSRMRTARRSSSPQAIRQESAVGIGDAPRTGRTPQPAAGVSAEQRLVGDDVELIPEATPAVARTGAVSVPGEGPLDAEAGERRFDVEARGVAGDVVNARAGATEAHPGPLALSSPSAVSARLDPDQTDVNRGPGDRPGAVARPSEGEAASVLGAKRRVAPGDQVAVNTQDPVRARYEREIRRRVTQVLAFPRRLALMLEQGETIVRFTVGQDGRVTGDISVVKSAGFKEFDTEAVGAVLRAGPFPRMPMTLVVNMRVPFQNPVIR